MIQQLELTSIFLLIEYRVCIKLNMSIGLTRLILNLSIYPSSSNASSKLGSFLILLKGVSVAFCCFHWFMLTFKIKTDKLCAIVLYGSMWWSSWVFTGRGIGQRKFFWLKMEWLRTVMGRSGHFRVLPPKIARETLGRLPFE